MKRMTERERNEYARTPDMIPHDAKCDRCEKRAVARGSDMSRAFALCADHYMAVTAERRGRPRVDAAMRASAINAAV